MTISNFVPTIWSPAILQNLRTNLVYGNMLNRDYEGDIANVGASVNITSFGLPATRAYTKNADISYDLLSDSRVTLTVDQADYFAFTVDDVDKRQALPGFIQTATSDAGYQLANKVDTYVAAQLIAQGTRALGPVTVSAASANQFYDNVIIPLRTALKRANAPQAGRWIVLTPEMYAVVLRDSRFIKANESGSPSTLRTGILGGNDGDSDFGPGTAGWVGSIAGFDVFESNQSPADATSPSNFDCIAGSTMGGTFADQIMETEALRLQKQFGDAIRGLHTYGMKLVRPTLVQYCQVVLTA